jgi:hypothetical protein
MDIQFQVEGFENRSLCLRTATFFSGHKLLVDGVTLKHNKGSYTLHNNQGKEVEIKIKSHLIDPIPKINVAGDIIELTPPLNRYEYVWIGVTAILLFIGGFIGALCAFWAIYFNMRIFRNRRLHIFVKYILTGLVSIIAFVVYYMLGTRANLLLKKYELKAISKPRTSF